MHVPFVDLKPTGVLAAQLNEAYERVMASGTYIRGKEVAAFEEAWAEYVGTKHCIGVGSGSDALRFLCHPYEAVVVPWNSTPTVDALQRECGVIRGNVQDDTRNLTPEAWWREKPVVAVHLYGQPCDVDAIRTSACYVVEDAAQAHGAKYKGRNVGTLADAAAWSFYPTKNLGAHGDAGAITTDRDDIAESIRKLRLARMDPLQAAFLRVKLPYLEGWNARRQEIAAQYWEGLADIEGLGLPVVPSWATPCWHLFVVRHVRRLDLMQYLADRGIETLVHYPIDPRVLSLPCAPHLTDEQVDAVVDAVQAWAKEQGARE